MTRVMKSKTNQKVMPYCKGAPEAIFQLCHFSEERNARYTQLVPQLAEDGYRVLAAAHCEITSSAELPRKTTRRISRLNLLLKTRFGKKFQKPSANATKQELK